MSNLKRIRTTLNGSDGQEVQLVYDKDDDILDIFFGENETATGIELTDHILLRLNQTTGRAVSITLRHFSILTERTEYGPRSFPIGDFDDIPEDLRDKVIRAIASAPVNQFLKSTFYQQSPSKQVPLTYVDPVNFASVA